MRRDRHGRGSREIYSAANFDADLKDGVDRLKAVWGAALRGVEFACDEIPDGRNFSATDFGTGEEIQLGTLQGRRITIYRLPISLRATTPQETAQLIFDTLVEQVAELLGLDPLDVHDDYGREE